MMPRAARSERDSSRRLGIPRKETPKRAELVAQQVPGLDNQTLDAPGGRLLLRKCDLLGSHGLQDLKRRSPFGELTVHDLTRKVEEAVVAEERAGGVLSDQVERASDLAPVDEEVRVLAGEDLVVGGDDAGDECACDRCTRGI